MRTVYIKQIPNTNILSFVVLQQLTNRAGGDVGGAAGHRHPPAGVGRAAGELHAVVVGVVGGRHRVPVGVTCNASCTYVLVEQANK